MKKKMKLNIFQGHLKDIVQGYVAKKTKILVKKKNNFLITFTLNYGYPCINFPSVIKLYSGQIRLEIVNIIAKQISNFNHKLQNNSNISYLCQIRKVL